MRAPSKPALLRGKIKYWMALHDMAADELAIKMHMSRSTFYARLAAPEKMTVMELLKLEKITGMELIAGGEETK